MLGCCPSSSSSFSKKQDDSCWRVAFVTAATWWEAAVSFSPCCPAFILAFALQTSSPASHIVAFWILATSTQFHRFQLSCDGVAEMGIWCRALAGGGCSHAFQLGPTAHHQQQHPC